MASIFMVSCDDDAFTMSPSAVLSFSTGTVSVDTVFSNVPSSMRSFWVYNRNGDGVRCSSVRLERGNQSGFRVNVEGVYLGPEAGYQAQNIELHKGDSMRVFIELTSRLQHQPEPVLIEDNLVFQLESGTVQKVALKAWSWDATLINTLVTERDTTITGSVPIVIRGGIVVGAGTTLTLAPGTTLYFHGSSGMEVRGTLRSMGTADNPVVMRGDRLDRMFPYLPYDRVSGQWDGLRLTADSYDNVLEYTDLHGAFDGIVADSSDIGRTKLLMRQSTVHNCDGVGVSLNHIKAVIENCQITNTHHQCVYIQGGDVQINHATIAQFYPFEGNRLPAFQFESPLQSLLCRNTLITGYADDELVGMSGEEFNYKFENCIIRTPAITTADSVYFENVIYEDVADTLVYGRKHFATFDTDNLIYNFELSAASSAIDKANPLTSSPYDRNGNRRDENPDIGAFEYKP